MKRTTLLSLAALPPLCIVTADGAVPSSVPLTFESDLTAFLRKRFHKE